MEKLSTDLGGELVLSSTEGNQREWGVLSWFCLRLGLVSAASLDC